MRNRQKEIDDLYALFKLAADISEAKFAYFNSSTLASQPAKIAKVCAAHAIFLKQGLPENSWPESELFNKLHQHLVEKEKHAPSVNRIKLAQFLRRFVSELYKKNPFDNLNTNVIDKSDIEAFASKAAAIKLNLISLAENQREERYRSQNEAEEKRLRTQHALTSFEQTAINTLNEYKNLGRRHFLGRLFGMDPANKKIADSLQHSIETILGSKKNTAEKFIAINAVLYEKGNELLNKKSKRLFPLVRSIHQQLIEQVKKTGDKLIIEVVLRENDHLRMHHPKRKK